MTLFYPERHPWQNAICIANQKKKQVVKCKPYSRKRRLLLHPLYTKHPSNTPLPLSRNIHTRKPGLRKTTSSFDTLESPSDNRLNVRKDHSPVIQHHDSTYQSTLTTFTHFQPPRAISCWSLLAARPPPAPDTAVPLAAPVLGCPTRTCVTVFRAM